MGQRKLHPLEHKNTEPSDELFVFGFHLDISVAFRLARKHLAQALDWLRRLVS